MDFLVIEKIWLFEHSLFSVKKVFQSDETNFMLLLTSWALRRGIIVQGTGGGSRDLVHQRQDPILDIADYIVVRLDIC